MKTPRPELPPSCGHCRPYGGQFRNYGIEASPRMARCDCDRGKALGMGASWWKSTWWKAKQKPAAVPKPEYDRTGGDR